MVWGGVFPLLFGLLALAPGVAGREPSADEQVLRAAGLETDGSSLLHFFRQRTAPAETAAQVETLVRQLGGEDAAVRRRATGALVALGIRAVPALRQAFKDPDDREVAAQSRRCLEWIENPALVGAAARLVAERRPTGAAGVLLAYLPSADDDGVVEEVQQTLTAVAVAAGQPNPVVLAALDDPVPVRRWAAGTALCQAGGAGQAAAVRKLLRDPKPTVRLRTGLALAAVSDADAIPVLIDLLGELPYQQGRQAEDCLKSLAGEFGPVVPLREAAGQRDRCRSAWAAWWRGVNAEQLLTYFRKRTLPDAERDRVRQLVRQLGDDNFARRQEATRAVVRLGSAAIPLLHEAIESGDAEVVTRARECLQQLDRTHDDAPAAMARLLALRKPPDAAEALLAYVPMAEDEAAGDAVQAALNALAVRDGRPDPAVVRALGDPSAQRRLAAAEALCRAGAGSHEGVRRLLKEDVPQIRLRVARALVAARDKAGVPTLIDLLPVLPVTQLPQAEEALLRVAGDQAPARPLAFDAASRARYRAAWAAWWQAHQADIELDHFQVPATMLGYTLLVEVDFAGTAGKVREVGTDGRTRWQITGLRFPIDAQVLPGNRVLISEHYGLRVTERDFQGNILWQKNVQMPIDCQRLPNGNTFISSPAQLVEYDPGDHIVFSFSRGQHDIVSARKLPDGKIACVTAGRNAEECRCLLLDTKGKELRSFWIHRSMLGGLNVSPDGRLLIPAVVADKVVELDESGKPTWEVAARNPTSAQRLANGHTLVASQYTQRVTELDRTGKPVWEFKSDARPWRVRRR